MSEPETTNDPCPARGPALNHMPKEARASDYGTFQPCEFCSAMVVLVQPPITRVGGGRAYQEHPGRPLEERRPGEGLIDRLLNLRDEPVTDSMLGRPNKLGTEWDAHRHAVDAALSIIVPVLRDLVTMASDSHGAACPYKPQIEEAIGHVPLRGWRS